MRAPTKTARILLLEGDYMLRNTIALTARSAGLATISETTKLGAARELLRTQAFDGVLLALGNEEEELELVSQLRQSKTASPPDVAIGLMVDQCDALMVQRLYSIGVDQIILRPFKVKTLLSTLQAFAA